MGGGTCTEISEQRSGCCSFAAPFCGKWVADIDMKKRKTQKCKKEIKWFCIFSIPALIIYTVFWIIPILISGGISFTDWTGLTKLSEAHFVGIKNYLNLFTDSILQTAVKNNIVYGVIMLVIVPAASFILAYVIETFVRKKSLWRMITYLPAILPMIVTMLLWKWIYNPQYGNWVGRICNRLADKYRYCVVCCFICGIMENDSYIFCFIYGRTSISSG